MMGLAWRAGGDDGQQLALRALSAWEGPMVLGGSFCDVAVFDQAAAALS